MGGQHIVDHLVECHPLVRRIDRTGIDLCHLEQIVNHLGEPNRFLLNGFRLIANLVIAENTIGYRL